jgi:proteic killer suppression protein
MSERDVPGPGMKATPSSFSPRRDTAGRGSDGLTETRRRIRSRRIDLDRSAFLLYHRVVHILALASSSLIASFRDEWLRDFFIEDVSSRNIPLDLADRLFRKLQMIDDATTDQDLRVPPSNHFEKLRGNLAGLYSIRVNRQWRLVFRWDGSQGEASAVYLDNHSYR